MSSKAHWDVPIVFPNGRIVHILASHATPPVFDGIENMNGLRNDAEIGFWVSYLDSVAFLDDPGQESSLDAPDFVLLGDLNNDPNDGEGLKGSIMDLLTHSLLADPMQLRLVR